MKHEIKNKDYLNMNLYLYLFSIINSFYLNILN